MIAISTSYIITAEKKPVIYLFIQYAIQITELIIIVIDLQETTYSDKYKKIQKHR